MGSEERNGPVQPPVHVGSGLEVSGVDVLGQLVSEGLGDESELRGRLSDDPVINEQLREGTVTSSPLEESRFLGVLG